MNTKSQGNPMKALLRRLEASGIFDIIIFGDDVILNQPIEEWPKVECLIGFYSNGFPLEKAIDYVRLVKPIEINRLDKQPLLRNRLSMYETLRAYEIPCPDFMFIDHDSQSGTATVEESDDFIIYNGRKLMKPFVEKPIDGDDHNIWIYYPLAVGGGCKKLIRKTDDKSSEFDPFCNKIRRTGAYLYEPFLPTQGLDMKLYMVFSNYSHAEARKAPTVDGKVMRSKDGKEIRYPIALSEFEKVCGALVVKAFGQNFCGFDVLRTKGGSVVCDVNGWSFVKGNQRYYDDAALLLQRYFLDKMSVKFPPLIPPVDDVASLAASAASDPASAPGTNELHNTYYEHGEYEEDQLNQSSLRSVLVIMRHGDRRPKEKLKFKTSHPGLLEFFIGKPSGITEILVKSPEDMIQLSERVRAILTEMSPTSEEYAKFDTLRMVLELHESFEGLTRKVQLKPIEWGVPNGYSSGAELCGSPHSSPGGVPSRLLVVVKWGGELTDMGRAQSEDLGRHLRQTLFPADDGADDSLLRLHSSFRHDFKIYSSIEGRCQMTAAAFTKGFLDLEGDITPILVSLVCYDDFARELLDEPIPKEDRDKVKKTIEEILHSTEDGLACGELLSRMVPTGETESGGIVEAVRLLLREGKPIECLRKIHNACIKFIHELNVEIKKISNEYPMVLEAQLTVNPRASAYQRMRTISGLHAGSGGEEVLTPVVPFTGPGPRLQKRVEDMVVLRWVQLKRIEHRWTKLVYGFAGGNSSQDAYDTSKVTDLWDCAYYDIVHHNEQLPPGALMTLERDLMRVLMPMHAWVSTAEFGMTAIDKLRIGVETTWRLLQKIVNDVEFMLVDGGSSAVGGIDSVPAGTPQNEIWQLTTGGSLATSKSPSKSPSLANLTASAAASAAAVPGRSTSRSTSGLFGENGGANSGLATPVATSVPSGGGRTKTSKVPPQLRALLRQAMRDGSDWHPQLHDTVAQITGMKTSKAVRTRVYVTSASTMHSLLNVLAFGKDVSDEEPIDQPRISHVTDLHYLSHFVIRCFEEPVVVDDMGSDDHDVSDASSPIPRTRASSATAGGRKLLTRSMSGNHLLHPASPITQSGLRYTVEVLFSAGVMCRDEAQEVCPQRGDTMRESMLCVAPLESICKNQFCSLEDFDAYLTEILAEFGKLSQNEEKHIGDTFDSSAIPSPLSGGGCNGPPPVDK